MRTRRVASVASVIALLAALTAAAPVSAAPLPPDLGPNVLVFDPSMPTSQIQAAVDADRGPAGRQRDGLAALRAAVQAGHLRQRRRPTHLPGRLLHRGRRPGRFADGRGINGHVDVYNRCLTPDNCIALDNFWRSLSNLTINVIGLAGCRASGDFWAVSQAAPMRRVNITGGNLTLMDYCTAGPQYASGGFIADSQTGFIINGSQQQFLVRDSSIGGWSNGVWNQVFSGVRGRAGAVVRAHPVRPAAVHHPGHQPGDPRAAVPLRGRERAVPGLCPGAARPTRAAPPGPAGPAAGTSHPDQPVLHREAGGQRRGDQNALPVARISSSRPASTTWTGRSA